MPNHANLCPITFNMKGNNGTMWPLRLPMLFPIATVTNKLPTNYMYMNRGGKCLHQSTSSSAWPLLKGSFLMITLGLKARDLYATKSRLFTACHHVIVVFYSSIPGSSYSKGPNTTTRKPTAVIVTWHYIDMCRPTWLAREYYVLVLRLTVGTVVALSFTSLPLRHFSVTVSTSYQDYKE